jgi:hypothetical protein
VRAWSAKKKRPRLPTNRRTGTLHFFRVRIEINVTAMTRWCHNYSTYALLSGYQINARADHQNHQNVEQFILRSSTEELDRGVVIDINSGGLAHRDATNAHVWGCPIYRQSFILIPFGMVMVVSIRSSCLVLCLAATRPSLVPTQVESFSLVVQESIRTRRRNDFRDAHHADADAYLLVLFPATAAAASSSSSFDQHRPIGRASSKRDQEKQSWCLFATGGGNGFATGGSSNKNPKTRQTKVKRGNGGGGKQEQPEAAGTTTASSPAAPNKNRPYVKAEHDVWLDQLAAQTSRTPLGQIVAEYNHDRDPFWDLMPALISSKFPHADHVADLSRIAGFVRHALNPTDRPGDWIEDQEPHRPYDELHAYMPGLLPQPPVPFIDPTRLSFCQDFEDHYDIIRQEYQALLLHHPRDLFQSVTSMNYQSGWQTLVLFTMATVFPNSRTICVRRPPAFWKHCPWPVGSPVLTGSCRVRAFRPTRTGITFG